MRLPAAVFLATLLIAVGSKSRAHTWSVPSECPTIQAGIDSASAGDTVLVACGTYFEQDIALKSGICLRGETGARDRVTIDAERHGRILVCEDASDTVRVEGFTLTRGSAAKGGGLYCRNSAIVLTNCGFSENQASSAVSGSGLGGAMCSDSCTVILKDCVFWANVATSSERDAALGGAIYAEGSSFSLAGCTLSNNLADGWYPDAGLGGGIYVTGSSATLLDCAVEGNVGVHGGGLYIEANCRTGLTRCTFSGNSAYGYDVLDGMGGGLLTLSENSSTTIVNCWFTHNEATRAGGGFCGSAKIDGSTFSENGANDGGGVCGEGSLSQCVFWRNMAHRGGGMSSVDHSEITDCTFCDNSAAYGSGLHCRYSSPVLRNTVLAFGTSGAAIDCLGSATAPRLVCCDVHANAGGDWIGCIADQMGIDGNICADPLFCNPDSGDFHLDVNSPCAPTHRGGCGLIGALGTACKHAPADLTLGVLQNPYLTQYLDVYLVSSAELDTASIVLAVGADTLSVRRVDDGPYVWMGDYELTGPTDSVSICGFASDTWDNACCATMDFSATFVNAARGGVATSPDGRMRVSADPGALTKDALVLILQGRETDSEKSSQPCSRSHDTAAERPYHDRQWPLYTLSPLDVTLTGGCVLAFRYDEADLGGEEPTRLFIEDVGAGPLESFVDTESRTVGAAIEDFGTFRLAWGPEGSSKTLDPRFLRLEQNYPNPFGLSTTIRFEIRSRQQVDVSVYDVAGRRVVRLLNRVLYPGSHELLWDGMTERGIPTAPGVYFCRLQSDAGMSSTKMLRLR